MKKWPVILAASLGISVGYNIYQGVQKAELNTTNKDLFNKVERFKECGTETARAEGFYETGLTAAQFIDLKQEKISGIDAQVIMHNRSIDSLSQEIVGIEEKFYRYPKNSSARERALWIKIAEDGMNPMNYTTRQKINTLKKQIKIENKNIDSLNNEKNNIESAIKEYIIQTFAKQQHAREKLIELSK